MPSVLVALSNPNSTNLKSEALPAPQYMPSALIALSNPDITNFKSEALRCGIRPSQYASMNVGRVFSIVDMTDRFLDHLTAQPSACLTF
jgi:hypothetical protein